ncbi:MAG: hypothetical protein WBQ69_12680, partial [Gallionella sp.]
WDTYVIGQAHESGRAVAFEKDEIHMLLSTEMRRQQSLQKRQRRGNVTNSSPISAPSSKTENRTTAFNCCPVVEFIGS